MKKFTITLLLFSATGVSFGMEPEEPMNTMPGTNNLLTQHQYSRVNSRQESVKRIIERCYISIDEFDQQAPEVSATMLPTHNKRREKEYTRLEREKSYDDALNKVLRGRPYKPYSKKEINQLMDYRNYISKYDLKDYLEIAKNNPNRL